LEYIRATIPRKLQHVDAMLDEIDQYIRATIPRKLQRNYNRKSKKY